MSSPDQWLENAIIFGVYPRGGGGSGVTPQQVQQSAFNFTAATGVDDAFEVVLSPPVASLTDGLLVTMSSGALQNNTSSPTLKVDSQSPKPIVLWAGTLAPGDIESNASYIFIYNLAADQFQLVNPSITTADTFAVQANFYNVAIDAGAANAYVATVVPNPTGSVDNAFPLYLVIGAGNTNTGDSTVTLNGTSYPILMADGSQIPAGALVASQMAFMLYSSSKSGFILMNPVLPSNTGGTLNHLLRSNGTIWVQSTSALLDASDNLSGLNSVAAGNLLATGNTLSSTNSNGNVSIIPNGTGATLIGSTTATGTSGTGAFLQVARGGGQGLISAQTYANTTGAANLSLVKSRSTTIGSFTTVQNGDGIGGVNFFADDGTALIQVASMLCYSSGAPSTGIVPTLLQFQTMNTSGALTTAMSISNAQIVTFTNPLRLSLINDTNGNPALGFTATASAVNYLQLTNNAAGLPVSINATGETNAVLNINSRGTGAIGFGGGAYVGGSIIPFQFTTTTSGTFGTTAMGLWSNDANGAGITFLKSRSTTVSGTGLTIVNDGDTLFKIDGFGASSSTVFTRAATIDVTVSGTPSSGVVPTAMRFRTTTTAGVLTTALTLGNDQSATFAGTIATGNLLLSANTLSSTSGNLNLVPNGTNAVGIGAPAFVAGTTLPVQVATTTSGTFGTMAIGLWSNDANGAGITFIKSRGTTIGTSGASANTVQTGDILSQIDSQAAAGGSGILTSARILTDVNGTVSGAAIPSRMRFYTMTTAGTLTLAMTISNAQVVTLANALPIPSGGTGLTALGTGVQTALATNTQGTGGIALDNGTGSTFTASVSFSGGNTGLTFTNQVGAYTRVGNTVTFSIRITLSAIGSATGNVSVTGFPIAGRNISNLDYVFETATQNMVYTGQVKCIMLPGTTSVMLYNNATGAGLTQLTQAAFTNTSDLIISGTYLV